jgi:hypothetical protein
VRHRSFGFASILRGKAGSAGCDVGIIVGLQDEYANRYFVTIWVTFGLLQRSVFGYQTAGANGFENFQSCSADASRPRLRD